MDVLSWLLVGVCTIAASIVAIIVMVNNAQSRLLRFLGIFIMSSALWGVTSALQRAPLDGDLNLWLGRAAFALVLTMTCAMVQFAYEVRGGKDIRRPWRRVATVSSMIAAVLSLTPFVIPAIHQVGGVMIPVRGPAYLVVLVVIGSQLIMSIGITWQYYRSLMPSATKSQAALIFYGLALGSLSGVITNVILSNLVPSLGSAQYAWIACAIWTSVLVYAVVKHGYLDIRQAVLRSAGYILSGTAAVVLYYGAAALMSYWFGMGAQRSGTSVVLNSFFIIAISLLFGPLKRFFDRVTNKFFNRAGYSRSALYGLFTERIAHLDSIEALNRTVIEVVGGTLRPNVIAQYVITGPDTMLADTSGNTPLLTRSEVNLFAEELMRDGGELLEYDPYERKHTPGEDIANTRHYALLYPLKGQQGVVGFLCLGSLESRMYNSQDRAVLKTVANEVSITVEKLLSLERIRGFNVELRDQVDQATKQLRDSNQRLLEMDATKDEFVSMASHQLRTPLTSVKGYISMVLEGDAGDITDAQRQLLSEAYSSSERMVHLIGDFLNVSRLQTGKFMIDRKQTNMAQLVREEVDGIQQIAALHDVTMNCTVPERFPVLHVDGDKLRQVIMNFVDNAIYYSPEQTKVEVKLEIADGDAVLTVTDQGMGVPEAAQHQLFTKFFRAENARKQRPDGTGIGLYLAKKIIDGHGGQVIFSSNPGEGSTFGFRLPIKRLSEPPAAEEISDQPKTTS